VLALSIDEWKEFLVQDKIVQVKFKIVKPGLQKAYERPRCLQTSASKPKKFFVCVAADNKERIHLKHLTAYNECRL
jgi:hypothetical protein